MSLKKIPLVQNRRVTGVLTAVIDDEDYEKVRHNRWYLSSTGYAFHPATPRHGMKQVFMHHLIVGKPPTGLVTDHVNCDKLDNRKKNLRFVTQKQNLNNKTQDSVDMARRELEYARTRPTH